MADTGPGRRAEEVLVLCYHALSERWPAQVAVSPSALLRQIEGFLEAGFRGTTFAAAVRGDADGKLLAVTFDDAYLSTYELGYPILAELGIPGTVFVPTAFQDGAPRSWPGMERWQESRWSEELRGTSWSQLRELAEAGWEIGSHTRNHTRLPALDDASLASELQTSRAECEDRTGRPCQAVAYPYGEHDERVVRAARDAGYVAGAGAPGGREPTSAIRDPMRWPRLGVRRADHSLRLRAKVEAHRHPRVWNLARRLRYPLG